MGVCWFGEIACVNMVFHEKRDSNAVFFHSKPSFSVVKFTPRVCKLSGLVKTYGKRI